VENDFSFENNIQVYYDNIIAINLSKNPIQHSKNKDIEVSYHFIGEYV